MSDTTTTKLERVKDFQFAFKSPAITAAAVAIIRRAVDGPVHFWPDEIQHDLGDADRNVIGSAFRWMASVGIICRTDHNRPSKAPHANGRTIFGYTLARPALARTFLERAGGRPTCPQIEMPL